MIIAEVWEDDRRNEVSLSRKHIPCSHGKLLYETGIDYVGFKGDIASRLEVGGYTYYCAHSC